MASVDYLHVDVFSERAYGGNSLPVFIDAIGLTGAQMLAITKELRHFEATFLSPTSDRFRFGARVFDLFEELPFAGHPIIGAAAALHEARGDADSHEWTFELAEKTVTVATRKTESGYFGLLDQGAAEFIGEVAERACVASAFGLAEADLDPSLPVAVVSTGLKYLIVPVAPGVLSRAAIKSDITAIVRRFGGQFAVVFDASTPEVRHWNNDGIMEDVATGSAAGTIGAYRLRYCGAAPGEPFVLNQGRFTGRPSQLTVEPRGTPANVHSVAVGGDVAIVGSGRLTVLP